MQIPLITFHSDLHNLFLPQIFYQHTEHQLSFIATTVALLLPSAVTSQTVATEMDCTGSPKALLMFSTKKELRRFVIVYKWNMMPSQMQYFGGKALQ